MALTKARALRVREAIAEFLTDLVRERMSESHVEKYTLMLRWFGEAVGNPWMSELDADVMKTFFYGGRIGSRSWRGLALKRNGQSMAGTSWNAYRQLMSKFVGDMRQRRIIVDDLMIYVKKMPVADPEYKIWLSAEEIVALLGHPELRPRDRAMLSVAFEFGPRGAELRRLRIKDYNPDAAIIRMRITKSRAKEVRIEDLPVSADTARALRVWFGEYARQLGLTLADLDPEWYMFPYLHRSASAWSPTLGLHGERYDVNPNKPCAVPERVVQIGLRLLGYTDAQIMRNGVHCARRSAGELAAQVDPRLAQALLGHESLVTTEKYLNRGQRQVDRNNYLRAGGWRAQAKAPATVTPISAAHGRAASDGGGQI